VQAEVIAESPCFLSARRLGGKVFVYRSILVRDEDRLYEPVHAVLVSIQAGLVDRQVFKDENMMFGSAEALWYHAPEVADKARVSVGEMAFFLGMSLEGCIDQLVRDSLLTVCEGGGYLPTNYAIQTGGLLPIVHG
jgi:hypothetical protein